MCKPLRVAWQIRFPISKVQSKANGELSFGLAGKSKAWFGTSAFPTRKITTFDTAPHQKPLS
jgi:hypothetical protein